MHLVYVLIFIIASAAGDTKTLSHTYSTLEACHNDGAVVAETLQKAVDAKELEKFNGACVAVDVDEVDKDPRGSI